MIWRQRQDESEQDRQKGHGQEDIGDSGRNLDPASLDFSTALEEMKDCTLLLEDGFSDKAVFTTANQTTSGELYDLLKDIAKPASEIEHSTNEEHVIDHTEVG